MGKGGASKGGSKGKGKGGGDQYADSRSPEEKRQAKKSGRRNAQMAKLDEKGQAEADYFWECKARSKKAGIKVDKASAAEIFGKQGTFAIDFKKYESVEVTRSGPGSEGAPAMHDFRDLGKELPNFLAQNLESMQYRVPTPIQKHAIPLAMRGSDLMCCAQTGSGKTAAFLLPVVASLGARGRQPACSYDDIDDPALPRCVIMAPTRELIQQIHVEALKCCHNSGGLRAVVIYGGAQARQQLAELGQGCDIAVATPGRLTDFVDRGLVEFRMVEHLVLDEADRMLDMGFEPQIRQLVQNRDMPDVSNRWTMMFSATFPTEIQKLAKTFMKPYVFIAVGRVGGTTENIEQRLVWASADKRQKFDLLLEGLTNVQGKTIVFVQKKRVATQIRKWLKAEGWSAEEIHGDRSQSQRESALAAFKSGEANILCATDVAARGLDIPKVAHVINFDLPTSPDEFDAYVHRIGRTGRAGHTGISTSFYVPGRDPKVGNGGIAAQLVQLFTETKNEVPDWFWQLPDAGGLRGGKAATSSIKNGSSDVRGGKEAVTTRTATKSAQPSPPRAPDSAAQVPNANAIGNFETAARKCGLQVWFEETPDPAEGFWCEAIIADSDGRELSRVESWNTKKKDAKYDAAKLGLASLEKLPQSRGHQNGAANPQNGAHGNGRAKEAATPTQSRTWKVGQDGPSKPWHQEAAAQAQPRTWHNGQGAGHKPSEETDWRAPRPQQHEARTNAEHGQRPFRPQPRESWENGGAGHSNGGGGGWGGPRR